MMARGTRPGLRPMEDIHNRNEGKGLMGLDPLFPRREDKTHCATGRLRSRVKTAEEEGIAQKQPRSQEKWHAI